MYEDIPSELKSLHNWVCWKSVPAPRPGDPNHIGKIPIDPKNGNNASSTNPDTWSDFDTAVKAAVNFSGIGFMFSDSPYFGVDIDGIEQELKDHIDGEINIVTEFIEALQSYSELSPSGKGLHILCKGSLPSGGRRKGNVEMYDSGRFFTVTGNHFGRYKNISECTEKIKALHEKYIGGSREPVPFSGGEEKSTMTADEIIATASNAKNGAKFAALFSGDYSAYGSQSEADMAFCNMLAFWTNRNAALMDEIYRKSGLMRDKWERQQSGSTYGALTIKKAIEQCEKVYSPKDTYRIKFGRKPEEEEVYSYFSLDDTGNSQRLVTLFGDSLRYNYTDKKWLFWDGRRWQTDPGDVICKSVDDMVEYMATYEAPYHEHDDDSIKAFRKHIKNSRSHGGKEAAKKEAEHLLPIRPEQLDTHTYAFNTPNGTVSLRDGKILPHKPEWFITKIGGVECGTSSDCPLWKSFLNDIFDGDKELIRYIQKAVGYSLTGDSSEQCVFFLYGQGRNGKSTFLDVIRDLAGDYATNIQPQTIMAKPNTGSTASGDIARLKGARFVTTVEPNEGMRLDEGLIKQLTGEDVITTRKLYGEEFEFRPEFKIWMATNHKPIIGGNDVGIWRRIRLIPFTVQIPDSKVDKHLKLKLEGEYPAILKWAIEGCLLWQKEGLASPKIINDEVKEYHREMDSISAFIEECCVVDPNASVQSSELYNAYDSWAKVNNEYLMSSTKFSNKMAERFRKAVSSGRRYFKGIKIMK